MTTTTDVPTIDGSVVQEFLGRALSDAVAAVSALRSPTSGTGPGCVPPWPTAPLSPAPSSPGRWAPNEFLVREWLNNQNLGGYVTYATGGAMTNPLP